MLKTSVADLSEGQTDMPHKGKLQTLTKLSMRYQVCPSETCHTIISESTIVMLMFRGRRNVAADGFFKYHCFKTPDNY